MLLGAHLSIQDGIAKTIEWAEELGMTAVSIFTASPKSLNRPNPKDFEKLNTALDVTIHAPYIINPASFAKKYIALKILQNEVEIAEKIGANRVVIHAGSATDGTEEACLSNLIEVINALRNTIPISVENNAGKGNEICSEFSHLALLLKEVRSHVGVCLDTCHAHDAGFNLDNLIQQFDEIIGLNRLHVLHVNGSLNPEGSKKDRHACISDKNNHISVNTLCAIVQHPLLVKVPKIVETFEDEATVKNDLDILRGREKNA